MFALENLGCYYKTNICIVGGHNSKSVYDIRPLTVVDIKRNSINADFHTYITMIMKMHVSIYIMLLLP